MKRHSIIEELENGYSVQSGVFSAVNDKIDTKINEYGQYEATIDPKLLSTLELDNLAAVSAMSNHTMNETILGKMLFGNVSNIHFDKTLGYYTDLYAGYVAEGEYRALASSGGIGTWLLVQLFEKKLIDGVIHVHSSNDGDGILFKYVISKNIDDIKAGAKSRYYPADLSEVLKTVKKTGGKYAITGIPSFITELRLLAEHDPVFKKSIAFTIGLVCGHQKSTKYAEALAWQHGIKPGDLIAVDFRKKVEGQPSSRYISEFTGTIDGELKTIVRDQDELFVSNWGHGMFKSKLSDFTDDTFNETADIALGDAWLPEYTNDSKGNNILIVRNATIAQILKEGLESNQLALDSLSAERVIKSQSGLVHHTQDELPYRLSKKDKLKAWRPIKRFEASNNLPTLRKIVQNVREEIALNSHEKYHEAVQKGNWFFFEESMQPLVKKYIFAYKLVNIDKVLKKGPVFIGSKVIEKIKRKLG